MKRLDTTEELELCHSSMRVTLTKECSKHKKYVRIIARIAEKKVLTKLIRRLLTIGLSVYGSVMAPA